MGSRLMVGSGSRLMVDSAAASSPEQSHRRAFGANECTKGASILAHSEWAQSPLAGASLGPAKLCSQESRGLVSAVLRPARLHCFPSQPDLPKPSSPSFSGFVLVLINQTQAIPVLLLCAVSEGPTLRREGALAQLAQQLGFLCPPMGRLPGHRLLVTPHPVCTFAR